ncbi:hypothetical protein AAHC03_020602 [Spirometra sp. Aus1]
MTSDVLDILELEEPGVRKTLLDTRTLLNRTDKKATSKNPPLKRPDHIPREVWGLQNTFKNELPPLVPADEAPVYKQPKVVIGASRVRRWQWVAFTNSARSDGLVLHHWRRAGDVESEEDYYFARFNKHIEVPTYTRPEYVAHLQDSKWTMEQTDHLMDLARQFDARFVLMQDRWDVSLFPPRPSIEDMKARYYAILASLDVLRGTSLSQGLRYDVDHERRRKQQLSLLYGRTRDEVEEEERLIGELNRIEARRRDRERKKQDLQKLISQAESVARDGNDRLESFASADDRIGLTAGPAADLTHSAATPGASTFHSAAGGSASSSAARKRPTPGSHASSQSMTSLSATVAAASSAQLAASSSASAAIGATSLASSARVSHQAGSISAGLSAVATAVSSSLAASTSIPFPDFSKNPGVHLRSQKMKLPSCLGQRKIRIIENFLSHYQMGKSSEPALHNILLLYELRAAMLQCDYELQAARSRMELFAPDKPLPSGLVNVTKAAAEVTSPNQKEPTAGTTEQGASAAAATTTSTGSRTAASRPPSATNPLPTSLPGMSSAGQSLVGGGSIARGSPQRGGLETLSDSGDSFGMSPPYAVGEESQSRISRRKRAAATEQLRAFKKLKTKDSLLD